MKNILFEPMKNGFMILGTLVGALLAWMLSPHMSDGPTNALNDAILAFIGSIAGFIAVAVFLAFKKQSAPPFFFQYRLLTLFEIMVVCAIIAIFGRNFIEAKSRFDRRTQKWQEETKKLNEESMRTGGIPTAQKAAEPDSKSSSTQTHEKWARWIRILTPTPTTP
jgi:hypothetical protein